MRKIIKAYLITSPTLYPTTPLEFDTFYKKILDTHKIDFACYRDKTLAFNPKLLEVFLRLNQSYKIPSLINSNFELGMCFGFDGLHCNASQMDLILEAKRKFSLVFFSAHTKEILKKADLLGVNGITISPIFKTPNKGEPLGVEFLNTLKLEDYKAEIFALGGIINSQTLSKIATTPIKSFASIRYFLN
ncbi:thiamine phosphate synthase [Helicobacter apodemus]|uniref:Thiamine phosphate synthase n=1 Tax=Helicobacter apodemus TaxID=135569 RepID=A0A2U8FDG7_9HELI|nr:thiamine phosphate synthase [Helicobacter apodemus]AWI34204.1 thiamine phosphate synthase [Helicobacter apodemus]